ncbi:MAG: esterase/lipase family protein [Sandaracinaceae bacterium]
MARQGQLLLSRPRFAVPHDEAPRVVVFVHGFGAGGAVFRPLRERVESELALPTVDFSYPSSHGFTRVAAGLAKRIERTAPRGAVLDVVGHSLGGLVARWYIQELGGAERVERLVTLATPHAGTRSARIAPGPLRRALLPGSDVVRRLDSGRARAVGVRHTALVAGSDLMVTPPASAAALPDADVRWFDELGHNAMLFDRTVHEAVIERLRHPSPSAAQSPE